MEINIKTSVSDIDFIEKNKIMRKVMLGKLNLNVLIFFISGLVIFTSGLSRKNNFNYFIFHRHFDLYTCFGLSIILLSLIIVFILFIINRNSAERLNDFVEQSKLKGNDITISINERNLKYTNFEITQEMAWSVFSNYKFYKDYLFLVPNKRYLNPIILNKKDLSSEDFAELSAFVKKTLKEMK